MFEAPSLEQIRSARERLGDRVRTTPSWVWRDDFVAETFGDAARVHLKLELFQYAGSFKARGALLNALALEPEQLARGVTAVSAGNHAMAVSFAARSMGTTAKVVMPSNANPARVEACRRLGAEIVLVENVHTAFEEVSRIEREEGRAFVHPFEGEQTILGTSTVGLEFFEQAGPLDAVVIPIGGGGLCSGIASAIKQLHPECKIYGVEPVGADSMHRSFAAGSPQAIEKVETIADSLGAPHAGPQTYALCRRYVDELVLVDDLQIRHSMRRILDTLKLIVEPAAAAATAAAIGPLRERLAGRSFGLIVCGSNIDADTFFEQVRGLEPASAG